MIKNRGAFVSRSSHPLGCIPHQKVDFFDIALEALHVLSLENRQSVAIDGLAITFFMNVS